MRNFTVFDIYHRNNRIMPNSSAVVWEEDHLSYSDLYQHSLELADWLARQNIGRRDRVAMLSLNHPGFFPLLGALAKLGAVLVPLNWRLAANELEFIIKDCDPKLIFCDDNQLSRARELGELNDIPVTGIARALNKISNRKPPPVPASGNDESPLVIIYTAAVGGHPSGATLSHRNIISANLQVISQMGLSSNDTNLAMVPLFHITGLNLALSTLQQGGMNVVMEKFSEEQTLRLSLKHKVTLWSSFPPILQRMTTAIKEQQITLPRLRYVVGIDNPENILQFEKTTSARFWILYGQSETSGFVTFSPASDKPGTAGKPGPLSNCAIVDENDDILENGRTGEIVVQGPLVFQGYWQQKELNDRTFRNGWHHTGDWGMFDDDGYLIYQGRKPEKELIKPGGENVYPAEVETVILAHPDVEAVVVIGVPDPEFGEGIKAICSLRNGARLTQHDLIEYVASRIARYKKPRHVEFIARMPMIGDQIDRLKIKELYGAG